MADLQKVQTTAELADRLELIALWVEAVEDAIDLRQAATTIRALQAAEAELARMTSVSDGWYDTATDAILAKKAALRDLAEMTRRAQRAEAEAETLLHTPKPVDPDMATLIEAETARADQAERERDAAREKVDGVETDLQCAVQVAWRRGAKEWARLNYPGMVEWLESCDAADEARSVLTGEKGE